MRTFIVMFRGYMEEQLRQYMQVMRNFGNVYTKKIADGIVDIKSDLRVSQMNALFAFKDAHCLSIKELTANARRKDFQYDHDDRQPLKRGAVRDRDGKDRRRVMVRLSV